MGKDEVFFWKKVGNIFIWNVDFNWLDGGNKRKGLWNFEFIEDKVLIEDSDLI